jgi:hypothetical protein
MPELVDEDPEDQHRYSAVPPEDGSAPPEAEAPKSVTVAEERNAESPGEEPPARPAETPQPKSEETASPFPAPRLNGKLARDLS